MAINFRNTRFIALAAKIDQCPSQVDQNGNQLPEIVMSGKSNVGKSSLINAISDNKKLARVSGTPGKTRAVIYFNCDKKLLIADLPGYGYARVSREAKESFSKLADDYFTCGRNINLVLHLIDIRHEPSKEDIGMLEYLNSLYNIQKKNNYYQKAHFLRKNLSNSYLNNNKQSSNNLKYMDNIEDYIRINGAYEENKGA